MFNYFDILLFFQSIIYIIFTPFTKVEESFNTQSIYDILHHPNNLSEFDHFQFKGVVPRTFIGSSFLSILSYPFLSLYHYFSTSFDCDDYKNSNIFELMIVRMILSFLVIMANIWFRIGIQKKFKNFKNFSWVYSVLFFVQFHFIFYSSRPLPNVYALLLSIWAYGYLFREKYVKCFMVLSVSFIVFRCEIVVLMCTLSISVFLFVKNRFVVCFKVAVVSICTIVIGIGISVFVDTYFWRRFVWPEGEVLYFNVYLNKSNEWGVMPFFWYFINSLPKSLLVSIIFIPIGVLFGLKNRIVNIITFTTFGFIFLYSFLPHKELRFIFYSLPLLNFLAAFGIVKCYECFKSKILKRLFIFLVFCAFFGSFLITFVFLIASKKNYYGGDALNLLHKLESNSSYAKHVHMDVHATMNGVTQFLYKNDPKWRYSKEEINPVYDEYTHLLTGTPEKYYDKFNVVAIQKGFDGLDFRNIDFENYDFRKTVKLSNKIYIMKKKMIKGEEIIKEKSTTSPTTTENTSTTKSSNNEQTEKIEDDRIFYVDDNGRTIIKGISRVDEKILNYKEKELSILRTPIMRWWQLWPKNIINMFIYDTKNIHYKFTSNSLVIVSELFKCYLKFYEDINIKKSKIKIRNDKIVVTVFKLEETNWPRLLEDDETPDYLRIDWDEWDDEFTVEVEDKEEKLDLDPEAVGYNFEFGEQFFKKYREKVNPEKRDKEREEKSLKADILVEDYDPYIKFLDEEKKKIIKKLERKAEKKKRKKEKIKKKKAAKENVNEYAKPKKEEPTEPNNKNTEKLNNLEKTQSTKTIVPEHQSTEMMDYLFSIVGLSKEKQLEFIQRFYGKFTPFQFALIVTAYMFISFFLFIFDDLFKQKIKKEKEE